MWWQKELNIIMFYLESYYNKKQNHTYCKYYKKETLPQNCIEKLSITVKIRRFAIKKFNFLEPVYVLFELFWIERV
ncbi:MAG: hypothetical protein COW65_14300 [Cytophagales bacterium CG18_big_fil_WC_8_21_14_2_50_42_9]|nr:MAG: hypothetical protein COW65_14300 [Cytophagales bacterium CG18_big_fil_WC_8_21_14_2_50_42_9]